MSQQNWSKTTPGNYRVLFCDYEAASSFWTSSNITYILQLLVIFGDFEILRERERERERERDPF